MHSKAHVQYQSRLLHSLFILNMLYLTNIVISSFRERYYWVFRCCKETRIDVCIIGARKCSRKSTQPSRGLHFGPMWQNTGMNSWRSFVQEISGLESELQEKDELLQRNFDKLASWKALLSDMRENELTFK